jgi:hypothetical protein
MHVLVPFCSSPHFALSPDPIFPLRRGLPRAHDNAAAVNAIIGAAGLVKKDARATDPAMRRLAWWRT